MIYGVIMAGGKGERFWPLSRAHKPKQFLKLTSDKTMLEETIERVKPLIPVDNIRIVAGESMAEHCVNGVEYLDRRHILTEPFGRNTCLAVALAAVHLQKADPEAVMVVLSADHLIRPAEKLLKILRDLCSVAAKEEKLITIGIVPTRPDTAYGYIKVGEMYQTEGETVVYKVSQFAEKPRATVAQEYYFTRQWLWNAGMFVWSAKAILNTIAGCQPVMHEQLMQYAKTIGTSKELTARKDLYEKATSISIDYAVLEKADNVLTVRAEIVWDDIGSWNALERYKEKDADNNVLVGQTLIVDSFETTVYNDTNDLIACIGISDLVVVRSDEITLVAHKTKVSQVKDLLAKLNENERTKKFL
ncbi:mannose-1-phosphate guanylyltransferase [candidate division GN15 bacterium]|uniref:mannose-1-phosphate guanylyltransferase n=1 Tax=candidate division GN15 bacterium TaxID=2072418 RepID=A0A855X3M1_9BACT|nr:MAG: mannose-1-phosphate guanylyltransferase [candidate division GN15 bacterium]